MRLMSAVIVLVGMLITTNAMAQVKWSTSAPACAADNLSIQADRYAILGGGVEFTSGSTGTIILYCQIEPFAGNPDMMYMTYLDANGTTTGSNITAQYIRMARSTGALTTIATLDSNSSSSVVVGQHNVAVSHTPDFENNVYYVRINITRNSTSVGMWIGNVVLVDAP